MKNILSIFLLLITSAGLFGQKFEGLALTPPMGWNSWNHFGCDVNEKLIRETTDAMVESGMKDAGYTYVVIDDCWHGQRDSLGFIHPDPDRFPGRESKPRSDTSPGPPWWGRRSRVPVRVPLWRTLFA